MAGQSQTLYRKWRSQTFSDLVGQEAVIRTLRQAVAQQRLTHAYLFCGPRGTGKTSTARLLAKMVNCANPRDGEPCNECLSCIEITEGRSTDVFEIDAASNRGIDEIRDLRDRVRIVATPGHTRIFIIDETHMLTTEAFNALLKTLEEPPPHVIFVLATTEAHKVPATVVSRCQHFEFRRIALRDIIGHLAFVSEQESMTAEPEALEALARAAAGGMRDALSLLDQARAFGGDAITAEGVRAMLGMADPALVREIVTFVREGDTAGGLHRINALAQSGIDLRQLASQIAEIWRQLMLARAGADLVTLLDVTQDTADDLKTLSAGFPLETLTECARIFARNDVGARVQVVPQLALELAFLDCVAVMQGKHQMAAAPARPAVAAPQSAAAMPTPAPAPVSRPAPDPIPITAAPSARVQAPAEPPRPALEVVQPPTAPSTNGHKPAPKPAGDAEPPPQATAVRETSAAANYGAAQGVYATVAQQWDLIKKICKQNSNSVAALLAAAAPVAAEPTDPVTIVIAVEHAFHLEKLSQPANRQRVAWSVQQLLDSPCQVRFIPQSEAGDYATQGDPAPAPTPAAPPPAPDARQNSGAFAPPPAVAPDVAPSPRPEPPAPEDRIPTPARAQPQQDALVQALQREYRAKVVGVRRLES